MSGRRSHLVVYAFLSLTVFIPGETVFNAEPVRAQGLWTEASVVGYGGLGFGTALAACWDCGYGLALGALVGGAASGLVLGAVVGSSAESAARRGERPGSGQLMGVRLGTVLAGAAVGAALAGAYINFSEGNAEGEDERNIVVFSIAGALLGILVEYKQEAWLREMAVDDLALRVRPTADGRWSVGLLVGQVR